MASSYVKRLIDKLPVNVLRIVVNFWLPFLGAGIKIEKVTPDFRTIEVSLKLRWYNKNYVGIHYGGSIFSMTDPFYMLMLIKNLGPDYMVLDKAAKIDYKKKGTGKLRATFIFTEEEINNIREKADALDKYIFDRPINVLNEENEVIATALRTLYVRKKYPESH